MPDPEPRRNIFTRILDYVFLTGPRDPGESMSMDETAAYVRQRAPRTEYERLAIYLSFAKFVIAAGVVVSCVWALFDVLPSIIPEIGGETTVISLSGFEWIALVLPSILTALSGKMFFIIRKQKQERLASVAGLFHQAASLRDAARAEIGELKLENDGLRAKVSAAEADAKGLKEENVKLNSELDAAARAAIRSRAKEGDLGRGGLLSLDASAPAIPDEPVSDEQEIKAILVQLAAAYQRQKDSRGGAERDAEAGDRASQQAGADSVPGANDLAK